MARPKKEVEEMIDEVTGEVIAPTPSKPKKPEIPRWATCVLDIKMANRPSTHPMKLGRGNEGHCIGANVISVGRVVKNTPEAIEKLNKQIDWRNAGMPNHHVFYLPADKVSEGQRIDVTCEWKPVYRMGQIVNYTYELNFNV